MLGIVSDVSFVRAGEKDKKAGIKFCTYVRSCDPYLPLIIESSERENQKEAIKLNASFLDKNSKKLPVDLRKTILKNFRFADFTFINPNTGEPIVTIKNQKDLQDNIDIIMPLVITYPDGSILGPFSLWPKPCSLDKLPI